MKEFLTRFGVMPRRKRTAGQNERQRKVRNDKDDDDDEEEEEDEDNTQIISDSETDQEGQDCPMKQSMSPRSTRRLERQKRSHVQDMTEEEMLDLALRLSKQEANSASHREQVEDDDMRKAIAESLQVSCGQPSEMSPKRARSAAKPPPNQDTVTTRARCKLSFPGEDRKGSGSDSDVPVAQTSSFKGSDEVGALPPMPDLSQPSPPSPTLPSVPSAASQESHSSRLAKQEFSAQSSDDEALQSDSQLDGSPVFLRNCSIRLSRKVLKTRSSTNISCTNSSSLSPNRSQNSPLQSNPKSPVFPKTDSKRCTKLTRDNANDSHSSFTDIICKPEDTFQEASSHKRPVPHSGKAQPSSHVSVPEGVKQEAVKPPQAKDESSLATGLSTVSDRGPNTDVSSHAEGRSFDEFKSHMVLHLSDDDDDKEEENEKIIPPSPVFPQERSSRTNQPKLSPTQPCCSPLTAVTTQDSIRTSSQAESGRTKVSTNSADPGLTPAVEGKAEGFVSYYWGVPFCPKGQSPDDYTQVILTQLEVYEKSLKEAQRQLLHKAEWGLPVFPCPVEKPHSRRLKRHRAPQLLEEEDEEDEEAENEGKDEDGKEKRKKVERKEREESQPCSEEQADNGQHETYVIVSSPETREEPGPKSPLWSRQQESTNSAKPSRKPASQDLSEDTQIQAEADEHGDEVQNGSYDVDNTVCPETQISEDNTPELMVTSPAQPQSQTEAEVMEVDEVTERPAEAEERMEEERPGPEQSWRESVPSQVECPMCTRPFPLSKIEIHAAYCDGTVEDQDQQDNHSQGSSVRKSVRRSAVEDDVRVEKSEQREKCYLCHKFFPNKEYSHHVDQCLQQKPLGPKQGNTLLSALNRTERAHLDDSGAGPSNTTIRNSRSLTDTSVTPRDGSDPQAPGYHVSSSPIKSFIPISELSDCLINFRQQYTDRPSQRLGRKRKFKR